MFTFRFFVLVSNFSDWVHHRSCRCALLFDSLWLKTFRRISLQCKSCSVQLQSITSQSSMTSWTSLTTLMGWTDINDCLSNAHSVEPYVGPLCGIYKFPLGGVGWHALWGQEDPLSSAPRALVCRHAASRPCISIEDYVWHIYIYIQFIYLNQYCIWYYNIYNID